MLRLFKAYLKPYLAFVIATVFFVIMEYVLQIFVLLPASKKIIDQGVANKDIDAIWKNAGIMMIVTLIFVFCSVVSAYFSARATAGFTRRLRGACFRKVEDLSPQDFAALGESTLVTRTMADVTQMQQIVINMLRVWLIVPVLLILELVMIARMNRTVFFVLSAFLLLTVSFLIYFGSRSREGFERLQIKIDRINLLMKERITGVRPIRAFQKEALEAGKSMQANEESYDEAIRANAKINFLSPAALMIMSWVVVAIYLIGTRQVQEKMVSISELILIFQYVTYFITSMMAVPFMVNMIPKAVVAARRINELMDYQPTGANNRRVVEEPREKMGNVEFKDVIFGYSGAIDVIANISFYAPAGKTTAIIGPTGCGKTTILNLMQGLYQPTFGDILIDGVSIRGSEDPWLREYFSYGTQRPMIFQDTVRRNIFPDPEKEDPERLLRALSGSCFDEVLKDRPEGLELMMSQGGMNVSGGQRQRLSIARTLAKDARIYLFDDTLSALDAKTEKKVLSAIHTNLKGKTVIMVAQKVRTIQDADHIIVLDKGRIVGQGRHEDLLKECGLYHEIYETQCYLDREGA